MNITRFVIPSLALTKALAWLTIIDLDLTRFKENSIKNRRMRIKFTPIGPKSSVFARHLSAIFGK
jgi:hypothetical protein